MEELKKQRRKEKLALVKLESKLNRYIQERSKDEVLYYFKEVMQKFRDFEKIHVSIHTQLEDNSLIEASDSDFAEVKAKCSESLAAAVIWLSSLERAEVKKEELCDTDVDNCDLISIDKDNQKSVNNSMISNVKYDGLEKDECLWKAKDDFDLGLNNACTKMVECDEEVLKFRDEHVKVDDEITVPVKSDVCVLDNCHA